VKTILDELRVRAQLGKKRDENLGGGGWWCEEESVSFKFL